MELDLPELALAFLSARSAARTGPRADADATAALLVEQGYPAHPAVLAFEAAYGGLQLFESDPATPALVVGPFACVSASLHSTEHVPVIYACDDVVYSLDAEGHGFTCARMVEGKPRRSAPNGRTLLTQAILWRALNTNPRSFGFHEGLQGASLARARGLSPIGDASGRTERWWGNGDHLVVEITRGNGSEGPMTYATI